MTKPMVRIHNLKTNEILDREMNAAEYKEYQANQLANKTAQAEAEENAAARQVILDRLGITADEAKLLLS